MSEMNEPNMESQSIASDPSLDQFAATFRGRLPRLSDEAMQRVAASMQAEMNRIHPPLPLPLVVAPAWPRWAAIAAMLLLTVGFSWFVSTSSHDSSRGPIATVRIVDEFPVVIETPTIATQTTAWDSLFTTIDRYASLLGIDPLARR